MLWYTWCRFLIILSHVCTPAISSRSVLWRPWSDHGFVVALVDQLHHRWPVISWRVWIQQDKNCHRGQTARKTKPCSCSPADIIRTFRNHTTPQDVCSANDWIQFEMSAHWDFSLCCDEQQSLTGFKVLIQIYTSYVCLLSVFLRCSSFPVPVLRLLQLAEDPPDPAHEDSLRSVSTLSSVKYVFRHRKLFRN